MQPSQTTWHILGVGSLGGLWATRLASAGWPVQLLLRNAARVQEYHQHGGLILEQAGHCQTLHIPAEVVTAPSPIRRLVVACKAYDALTLMQSVRHRLVPNADILLLQNGLGSQQQIAEAFPEAQCWVVSSTEGAFRRTAFHIVHAGHGNNSIGHWPPSARTPAWLDTLQHALIPHEYHADMRHALWRKLAINCAINPLTVLHDCCNGALRQQASSVEAISAELTTLLVAVGCLEPNLRAHLWQVIDATAANSSSMRQDVAQGRRTEIAYVLGYACAEATRQRLAVPHLRVLLQRLQAFLDARGLPSH